MKKIKKNYLFAIIATILVSLPVLAQNIESYRQATIKTITNQGFDKIDISSKVSVYENYIKANLKEGSVLGTEDLVINLRVKEIFKDYLLNIMKNNNMETDDLDQKSKDIFSQCFHKESLYEFRIAENTLLVEEKLFDKDGKLIFNYKQNTSIDSEKFLSSLLGNPNTSEKENLETLFSLTLFEDLGYEFLNGKTEAYFINGDGYSVAEYYTKKYYESDEKDLLMFLDKETLEEEDGEYSYSAGNLDSYARLFSSKDTLAMKKMGYRTANISDLLAFGANTREFLMIAILDNYIVLAPGTIKKYRGSNYVPALEFTNKEAELKVHAKGIDIDVINSKTKRYYLGIRDEE